MKSATLILVVAIALLSASQSASAVEFEFCDGRDQTAPCYTEDVTDDCKDVPEEYDDKISSLSTTAQETVCVTMFTEKGCEGAGVWMPLQWPTWQKDNMPDNYDNQTSSVRLCQYE